MTGIATAVPVADAWAWLDAARPADLACAREGMAIDAARGRVTAAAVVSPRDLPDRPRAAHDGFSVVATQTEGASLYSPMPLAAAPILAGAALPDAADAVLAWDAFDAATGAALTCIPPGEGVIRRGDQVRAGDPVITPGRVLRPQDLALLAELAIATVEVARPPRILVWITGPQLGADTLTPLLAGLLAQDSGRARFVPIPCDIAELADTADLFLLAGGESAGDAIAAGVRLDLHGIAIRPGGASGLGWLNGVPVVLLPGEPLACLAGYTLLASRLVRRLAGLAWPGGSTTTARLRRKIVSGIGLTDMVRVVLHGDEATPLGGLETAGLAGAARADGFVLVPEASEGFAAGSTVTVHDCRRAG